MPKFMNPKKAHPPLGRYTHGVEIAPGARMLHVSGQVGIRPDGSVAEGIEAQLDVAWQNVMAVLEAAGMSAADVVKVTTYVTKPEHFAAHPRMRAKYLGDCAPAATGVCVTALARPDLLCEIEIVAACA